jgi:hypothetical protein
VSNHKQHKKPIHTLKSAFVIIKAEGSPEFINQALKGVTKALKEKSGCKRHACSPSAQDGLKRRAAKPTPARR